MTESKVRVVIAEDESIIRLDLRETLEEEGYEVVGDTGRGDQAVELVRELEPEVAILDIRMPGMDGIEATRRICEGRTTAVVLLTSYSQRDLVEQAIAAGALAYLVKPFLRSDIVPAVEVARARHRELRALAEHAESLEDRLETRKLIDRAKGVLMDRHGLTEADAFGFVQRRAMSERRTMKDVAQDVIEGRLVP